MVNAGWGRGRRRRQRPYTTAERAPVRRNLRTWELERPAPGATSSSGRGRWRSCWGPTRASEHFDLTSSAPSSSWSNPGPLPERRQRLAASARCWRGPSTNACRHGHQHCRGPSRGPTDRRRVPHPASPPPVPLRPESDDLSPPPTEVEETTRRLAWADYHRQLEAHHAPPRDRAQQRQRQQQQRQMHAAQGVEEGPLPTLQTLLEKAAASAEADEAERTRREKPARSAAAKRRRSAKSEATQRERRRLGAAGSGSGSDQAGSDGSGRDMQPLDGLRAGGRERPAGGPGQAMTLLLALVGVSGHGSGLLPPISDGIPHPDNRGPLGARAGGTLPVRPQSGLSRPTDGASGQTGPKGRREQPPQTWADRSGRPHLGEATAKARH